MKRFSIKVIGCAVIACISLCNFAANRNPWQHKAIGLDAAKKIMGEDKRQVKVAVIDSGIDFRAELLEDRVIYFYDAFTDEECKKSNHAYHNHQVNSTHGTKVATVIAGAKGYGIAPTALIMSLIAINEDNQDTLDTMAKCIEKALDNKADIINISAGNYQQGESSYAIIEAIGRAHRMGVPVVIAAGNEAIDDTMMPSGVYQAICVASVDKEGILSESSGHGWNVDICAPGVGIVTNDGKKAVASSGTSYSAPMITGAFAFMMAKDENLKNGQLESLLYQSAEREFSKASSDRKKYGFGTLNLGAMAKLYNDKKNQSNSIIKSITPQKEAIIAIGGEHLDCQIELNSPLKKGDKLQMRLYNENGMIITQSALVEYNQMQGLYFEDGSVLSIQLEAGAKRGALKLSYDYESIFSVLEESITQNAAIEIIIQRDGIRHSEQAFIKILKPIEKGRISQSGIKYASNDYIEARFNIIENILPYQDELGNKYSTKIEIAAISKETGNEYTLSQRLITKSMPLKKGEKLYKFKIKARGKPIPAGKYEICIDILYSYNSDWEKIDTLLVRQKLGDLEIKSAPEIYLANSAGGKINLSTLVEKNSYETETIYVLMPIADDGYKCTSMSVNGKLVSLTNGRYKIKDKKGNIEVYAEFKKVVKHGV